MDVYPEEYVAHNLPLIVLSGLDSTDSTDVSSQPHSLPEENGATLSTRLPPVAGEQAKQLLQEFLNADARDAPWNGRPSKNRPASVGFRVRAAGRVGQTPITPEPFGQMLTAR